MLLGHFGVGFASKRLTTTVSLGFLVLAALFLDLLWPVLLLLGVEEVAISGGTIPLTFVHYPYSHSLLFAVLWGGVFAGAYYALRRDGFVAVVLGLLVVSHWILDVIVHVPDLPLYPGGPLVGFGLWNAVWIAFIVEFGIYAVGVVLYARVTDARDRVGVYGLWALVAVPALVQLGNSFGPVPPSVSAVAVAGLSQWLFVALAFWVDRHRRHSEDVRSSQE